MGTVQTNIRLDKELREWYDAKAVEHDRDASYFMKKALVNFRQQFESLPSTDQNQVKKVAVSRKESKPKEKFDASEVDYIGLNRSAWLEWCEYRKSKRKAISKAAAKKQVETLMSFDEEVQKKMIDQSIANDYQGIFELKAGFNSNGVQFKTAQEKRAERNAEIFDYDKATNF